MSTGNRFPVPKTPEERAEYVAAHFENCGPQVAAYIRRLRADFRALKRGEAIMGCKTWTEFCEKVLKRTDRAMRYAMNGGNPRSSRKPSVEVRVDEDFDWKNHWRGMPEFEQNDARPFKSLYVHFDKQEHVNKFAELVGQKITPDTRYIWYPKQEKVQRANKRYVEATKKPGDKAA